MRSFFLILSISTITYNACGMLVQQQPLCPRAPFLAFRINDPRTAPEKCQTTCAPMDHPVMQALEQGDSKPVIKYFTSWRRWVEPWHYHGHNVAIALQHAVGIPVEKTGETVAFLLTKLDLSSSNIAIDPTCLLKNAIMNGHINVVRALNTQFPELGYSELLDAALKNEPDHFETLLTAGVDPNTLSANIKDLPKGMQTRIQTLLMNQLMPRQCMSDDAPTTQKRNHALNCQEFMCYFGGIWCFRLMLDVMVNWRQIQNERQRTE